MKEKRSRLIVGVGILCFVGVMAVWLASSGDRAIADAEHVATITKSITQASSSLVDIKGITKSKVTFAQSEGVVHRLSVYVNLKSQDARKMKVYLTSPSGTKVMLVDGANSNAVKKIGLEGWFGTDGLPTAQSLAAFAGESATGDWHLTVDSKVAGKLTKWSLTADLSPNTIWRGWRPTASTMAVAAATAGCPAAPRLLAACSRVSFCWASSCFVVGARQRF